MTWLTRSHVHVDRMACPWLIARFIDSEAAFRHRQGLCNCDVLIKACERKDRTLHHLVRIVNAADTERLDRAPRAAGSEATAVGSSMRFSNANDNLAHRFDVDDATLRPVPPGCGPPPRTCGPAK